MIAHVLTVIFVATVVRSAFGFGEALIAAPLLALIMSMKMAAPLAVLISITVSCVVLAFDWRHVHFRSAVTLSIASLFGNPIGALLLIKVDETVVKAILGVFIIGFSTYFLLGRARLHLQDDRLAWIFGFAAGILGGAYGMNGPPLVIYGSLRRWSPELFRATLQGYFLPSSLVTLAVYWGADLLVWDVGRYYLVCLPASLVAIFLGRWISQRLNTTRFIVFVHVGLILVGGLLLVHSLFDPTQ